MAVMMTVAGVPLRVVLVGAVIGAAPLLAIAVTLYRRERLQAYLNWQHPIVARRPRATRLARRGLLQLALVVLIGLGLGSSVQAYGYLPEAPNDSILQFMQRNLALLAALFCWRFLARYLHGCSILLAARQIILVDFSLGHCGVAGHTNVD